MARTQNPTMTPLSIYRLYATDIRITVTPCNWSDESVAEFSNFVDVPSCWKTKSFMHSFPRLKSATTSCFRSWIRVCPFLHKVAIWRVVLDFVSYLTMSWCVLCPSISCRMLSVYRNRHSTSAASRPASGNDRGIWGSEVMFAEWDCSNLFKPTNKQWVLK